MKFKADPDFEKHNQRADETAARELQDMLAKIAEQTDPEELDDVYRLAHQKAYNVPALKKLVKIRKNDPEREKYPEDDLQLYKRFVGMVV